jgi:hypothetical protein
LACAEILMHEYTMGYQGHDWLAMGHLAQAEEEIIQIFPQRAIDIRNYRKQYEENRLFQIPVLDLINAITEEFENMPEEEQKNATHDDRKINEHK